MGFTPTPKQAEAWDLLVNGPTNVMLEGGARSGKTLLICEEILCRAVKYPGSRHLVARLRFSHAKRSLWLDTFPTLFKLEKLPRQYLDPSEADHYFRLPNGSEIWIDGLDDKDRVEKILGREYATIFLNEISQISYPTVLLLMTRLAQNIPGCPLKMFHDLNPVGRSFWAFKLFKQGLDPITGEKSQHAGDYATCRLNPEDNRQNLPPGYIENILNRLPEHKRRRFKLGEWGDPEGVIFNSWEVIDEIPDEVRRHSRHSMGLDFGFSVDPAAWVDLWWIGEDLYVDELLYETELTNQALAVAMKKEKSETLTYADSAEPKSIQELRLAGIAVRPAAKGPDSVRNGIDWLLSQNIHVTKRSINVQNELENYTWKTNREERALPDPIDDFNHAMDAIRYGCEPWIRRKTLQFYSSSTMDKTGTNGG